MWQFDCIICSSVIPWILNDCVLLLLNTSKIKPTIFTVVKYYELFYANVFSWHLQCNAMMYNIVVYIYIVDRILDYNL